MKHNYLRITKLVSAISICAVCAAILQISAFADGDNISYENLGSDIPPYYYIAAFMIIVSAIMMMIAIRLKNKRENTDGTTEYKKSKKQKK